MKDFKTNNAELHEAYDSAKQAVNRLEDGRDRPFGAVREVLETKIQAKLSETLVINDVLGNITITLPPAQRPDVGKVVVVKNLYNKGSIISVEASGTDTIDGTNAKKTSGFDSVYLGRIFMIIADGKWGIIAEYA
ncbi:MAG: hypothetical protein ACYTFK_13205 [Planctomycetota bacterium]|jgi:hypothetical protein